MAKGKDRFSTQTKGGLPVQLLDQLHPEVRC